MLHPGGRFEVEGDDAPPAFGYEVRIASIDADFFGALGAPVLSGRGFTPTDLALGREVAIVNTLFVERVLRGRNPDGPTNPPSGCGQGPTARAVDGHRRRGAGPRRQRNRRHRSVSTSGSRLLHACTWPCT